ncbi:RanBP-type and C3HC4-type zinc finger-containing protein 1 [Habropoda laboriosa]|uniref:RanBP-type and C3HC4-type zinc finger-containing protein 1 n=1 Tax=Habropoda laboriosa TaxID=597456 RepID=A0A0L7R3Y3_9HYME|nr:RanBP-type and C3HC4-type zinc finger-containing protein 1 [Habropoda laboriosa]
MVQRAACSIEANTFPNGVRISDREGRTSDVVATETSVDHLGRGNARFSLFKWFKRGSGNRESTVDKRRKTNNDKYRENDDERQKSVSSSVESVDTVYSTTTVRSFAFHTGTLGRCNGLSLDILEQAAEVGPFAAGASKVTVGNKENELADVASTLPTNAHSYRRDITARYSLQPTATFNSCGNLPLPDRRILESLKRLDDRKAHYNVNSTRRRVHVKGKRKAPNPPVTSSKISEVDARETPRHSCRRKRPAPKPPEKNTESSSSAKKCETPVTADGGMDVETRTDSEDVQTLSNDTLVLQGGVLLPKREIKQKSRETSVGSSDIAVLPDSTSTAGNVATLSTAMPRPWLSFFHRGGQSEDRKREAKRKSGLSILTNISELDKEAAAIVQEEQARARASMLLKSSRYVDAFEKRSEMNEELVQDIVTSAMESSSPRRGTRALISKFNAISNITKVTVNANFFARNARDQQPTKFERDVVRNARPFEHPNEWKEHPRFPVQSNSGQAGNIDKDISRYFPPQPKANRNKLENTEMGAKICGTKITKEQNDRLASETSNRISFLQSQLVANRMNDKTPQRDSATSLIEEKMKPRQEVANERKERETKAGNEDPRGYKFGDAKERRASNIFEEPRKLDKQQFEGVQKEFSDIFDEIDKQLRMKELKLIDRRGGRTGRSTPATNQRGKVHEEEAGISSKVTKVLDILVEAEKDAKTKNVAQLEKSIPVEEASRSNDRNANAKSSSKTRSPLLNTVEDPITTDLKEMLKEMKHSLPKRSKPGKIVTRNTDVTEKPATEKETTGAPTSKTTYFVSAVTKVENIALQNDYELDKQKVSCSVQTSGNIRRLNQPSTSAEQPSTSGWKQENVLYKTSGKNLGGSGLVKNTFQLIRPRDFAEIEATKTTKTAHRENTYANVIEQSIYANAHVPPSPKQRSANSPRNNVRNISNEKPSTPPRIEKKLPVNEDTFEGSEEDDNSTEKNMNTLAINRLLRKLEAAIASGHHQQAAGLAKELARLKIHCSVIRQRSARLKDQLIKVNMYIEDKLAHQGPIPLQLPSRMTVAELKTKIHTEFEIPTNVQRWIIGKNLADRDEVTLNELQAVDGSPVFLYLVAPELRPESVIRVEKTNETEEVANVINDDTSAPTEVLQIVEENREVVEGPQETEERNTPEEVKMDRYEELISLENCDVIPNSEPIECPVCFVTYGPREGVILRDCLHMFCRSCIANTIRYCEEAEVKCPYRDSEYTCESTLQEREIKALVEPEIYQQHLAKSIAQAENNAGNNAFHCKTPDCPGWCIYDDDVNNFLCPVCGANNCLTCQAIHAGKNCKQYQQELRFSKETDQESRRTAEMLEDMVDRGEALACPTCAVVLMKKWGCDWLRCSMCKTEICWVTRGPRWGPGGKGDTSGGCRCGENGVKCHPRCNYCH